MLLKDALSIGVKHNNKSLTFHQNERLTEYESNDSIRNLMNKRRTEMKNAMMCTDKTNNNNTHNVPLKLDEIINNDKSEYYYIIKSLKNSIDTNIAISNTIKSQTDCNIKLFNALIKYLEFNKNHLIKPSQKNDELDDLFKRIND